MNGTFRFPVAPFGDLRREMDRLLDEFGVNRLRNAWRPVAYPALNIWDEGEALAVEAEVPGVRREDLEVTTMGSELTIRGRREVGEARTFHRQERGAGEFSRVITLPVEVNPDAVEATLKDGVLFLRLPKAETARPRKITLKSS